MPKPDCARKEIAGIDILIISGMVTEKSCNLSQRVELPREKGSGTSSVSSDEHLPK